MLCSLGGGKKGRGRTWSERERRKEVEIASLNFPLLSLVSKGLDDDVKHTFELFSPSPSSLTIACQDLPPYISHFSKLEVVLSPLEVVLSPTTTSGSTSRREPRRQRSKKERII